jgi:leucyl aminopeptidase
VGIGDAGRADSSAIRDNAAAFSLAVPRHSRLVTDLAQATGVPAQQAAQAVVEGVLLARYRYTPLRTDGHQPVALTDLTVLADEEDVSAADRGTRHGLLCAGAAALARDLANTPPSLLPATAMARCAQRIAAQSGLQATVFDKDELVALGCGGLLGVNRGSTEPPRMIKLEYRPSGSEAAGQLTLVGKGVMYDSGGISLKPSDAVHATMKNDMSGAAAILAAMSVLGQLQCPTAVTGYLMCTDNMPSGSAMKLGDVLTIHGGTTVEVINTDAEGRLVMADALVLAAQEGTDAIVDIATLTGACLRALGPEVAGVMGNDQVLVDQVTAAARRTDEPVWQLPLDGRYRGQLDSEIADLKNVGGPYAGAITAGLFLAEFVGGLPWAHLDIAGPAQNDAASGWRPQGCTGFGTRLLIDLAMRFRIPRERGSEQSPDSAHGRAW